jgi:hypothetical protein
MGKTDLKLPGTLDSGAIERFPMPWNLDWIDFDSVSAVS